MGSKGKTSGLPPFKGMWIGLFLLLTLHWQPASSRYHDYANEIYNWQTGPWGVCWSSNGCGQGLEERVVWCGDSLGRPVPLNLCENEKKPLNSRPCYSACEGRWKTGLWSPCILLSERRAKQADGLCIGHRNRIVICDSSLDDDLDPRCPDPAPPANITCYTPCPQDCVVGPWSTWTRCESCHQRIHRTRQVIVAPQREGEPCPPISQSRSCHSECKNASTTTSSEGLTTTLANQPQTGRRNSSPKLRVGEWGPCPQASVYHQSSHKRKSSSKNHRKRKHLKADNSRETRLETEFQDAFSFLPFDSQKKKNLPDYLTKTQMSKLSEMNHHPQVGVQERNLSCVGQAGQQLEITDCLLDLRDSVDTKKSCIVPVDCKVTQWTEWQTSVEGCVAPNGQVVREVKIRKRTALTLQKGNGSPCPHLLERHTSPEPSLIPCSARYKWLASSWGPCLSTVGPEAETEVACGGGVQKREIICVHTDTQVPVEEKFCVHVEPPPRYQRCEVGCERDCVVGPWSMWGMCTPEDCSTPPSPATEGFRRRRREIVVSASSGGRDCPPLEEQTECLEPQCHKWIIGSWSECQLEDRLEKCGRGLLARNVSCINSLGAPSPSESCRKELGPVPETEACQVPCPFDCVLAEWSSWSPCSRPCSDKLSVGYTHRNTSILAPPGPRGNECPAPDELTQVKTCREEPCAGAAWIAGEWESCTPKRGQNCGHGVQRRPIYCIDLMRNQQTDDLRCSGLTKPFDERACEVACITQCSLSAWSLWSGCQLPKLCPEEQEVVTSVQKRWRKILVEPSAIAEPCGHLEEERACAVSSGACKPAKWITSVWSRCNLSPGVSCGTGYRVRGLRCINGSGEVTEPSHCLMGDKIVPESSEECFIFCNNSCTISKWSDWSSCPPKSLCSGATMKRTRQLLDGSENDPLCLNLEQEQSRECPCQLHYSEPVSDWSECILGPVIDSLKVSNVDGSGAVKAFEVDDEKELLQRGKMQRRYSLQSASESVCGVGNRYRSLRCLREDGILADPSSCGNKGMQWEPCMTECPSDCLVGPWGLWTPCNATCGAGVQFRRREVVQRSLWSGRACPETEQARACFGACNTKWIAEGWSDCILNAKEDCGTGSQERTVKCVQTSPSGIEEVTEDRMCDQRHIPTNKRPCNVYCPGNCVVSEWSDWSICPPGCPENQDRMRSRQVVRIPSGNASSCQHLREEETCLTDVSCWKYSWTVGNWTSCVPLGHSSCGEGVKNRPISCIRSDGIYVDERFCVGEARPSPQEKWCYVDCPIDCHVTHWSDWDDSKCSCGENAGDMKRRRYVLVNPSESGRPCPSNLQEMLPCPVTPCYTWERSPWSDCDLQGGTCGHGIMRRHVKCIGPGGTVAPRDKCLSLVHVGGHTWPYLAHALDLNTEDGCYVPCEGDCELTEWSPWSHCHRDCYRGHKGGTQTRSRAVLSSGSSVPCPGPLWENRPCISGPCLTFSWQVIHGTPTCIRSDGLVVTGGCGDSPRPCVPECTVKGSVCSLVGVCVCKPGLRPQYSESNRYHLTRCFPSFNLSLTQSLPLSQTKYLPESINGWMFAMIGIGSAFVVFVAISVYMMCKSPSRDQTPFTATQRRQATMSCPNSAVST